MITKKGEENAAQIRPQIRPQIHDDEAPANYFRALRDGMATTIRRSARGESHNRRLTSRSRIKRLRDAIARISTVEPESVRAAVRRALA